MLSNDIAKDVVPIQEAEADDSKLLLNALVLRETLPGQISRSVSHFTSVIYLLTRSQEISEFYLSIPHSFN